MPTAKPVADTSVFAEEEAFAVEATEPEVVMDEKVVKTHATPDAFEAAVEEADKVLDALLGRIGDVFDQDPFIKIMIYGDPGVGKTTLSASAPDWLMVNIEKGAKVLKNHKNLVGPNCQALQFKSVFQLEQLLKYLEQDHPAFAQYKTIIIDSYSELQKRDLDEIVRVEAAKDASRNKYLPIGPDYNINTEHLRQIGTALKNLNRHVIVTAHVKEEKDDSSGRLLVRPNLTPKLAGTMAGLFDVVGYLQRTTDASGNEVRTLQVHPTNKVTAKTRIGGLPPVIENPTFDILLTAYNK